ncbi:MAG: T9SS type A sorting domain-containing protein, partial [Candidatus Zixiibacteriota bacterium]
GNISADPMFMSETDMHLQAFSPLIDAGHPGYLDIDGSRSDIGAYGGPHGEAYVYQDLPPAIPDSLSGELVGDSIILNWRYNTEADFGSYLLHRDTLSGFEPSIFNLIAEPESSYYEDSDILPGQNYYYRIASLDNQGNVSDYSEELAVITTGIGGGWGAETPTITAIQSSYPNPFNSQTTIVYSVANLGPIPAQININIYDIMGRLVRRLVDERKEVGVYRITWEGRNDEGSECPSGVYFAKITQWDLDFMARHRKLILLR